MTKMQLLAVVATSLISMSALTGCSGDDPPDAPGTGGTTAAGGTAATAGTGTAGTGTAGTGTAGSGSSNVGEQLSGPAAYTVLSAADAPAGASAPAGYETCNVCHQANGQGLDLLAPEIRHTPTDFFTQAVRVGRKDHAGMPTGMIPYDATTITDEQLAAVATWLQTLPKPTTGEGLYKSMCGNCHGPKTPTGGGSPIKIQGATAANVDMYVRNGGSGTDINDRQKYMPKYDTTLLTDAELTLIKQFIGAI